VITPLSPAAVKNDWLTLRSLVQELYRSGIPLNQQEKPDWSDLRLLVVQAALLELLAQRWHQTPPTWVATVGGLEEPIFLVKSALQMPNLRRLCEKNSPEPLKKRQIFATPNFLEFV